MYCLKEKKYDLNNRITLIAHSDLNNTNYINWINFLKSSQNWSITQIENYQLSELKRIIQTAYENTNGYHQLFDDHNISPHDIASFEDFRKIPFLEKEMIRDRLNDFTVNTINCQYVTTGGSTGIPTGLYRTDIAFAKELASKAYQYYRVGWKEGDPQLVFRGIPIETNDHMEFIPEFNELRCSSYYLTQKWMEIYRQKAWEFKPKWLRCYPSSGYLFARFLRDTNRDFPPISGILCASENLYEYQKQLLSNQFNCRVFSHYGQYEMSVLAGYCEYSDNYHVLPQYGYAELVDNKDNPIINPGEIGQIVGTSFINNATLFIRYHTRDYAVYKGAKCSFCKRPYQIWERIEGRAQEFILTATGRYISMTAINMHDDIFDNINEFQFYQNKPGLVIFKYIPTQHINDTIVNNMKHRILKKIDYDIKLTMESVDIIPKSNRGKHTFLIQKLNINL